MNRICTKNTSLLKNFCHFVQWAKNSYTYVPILPWTIRVENYINCGNSAEKKIEILYISTLFLHTSCWA